MVLEVILGCRERHYIRKICSDTSLGNFFFDQLTSSISEGMGCVATLVS